MPLPAPPNGLESSFKPLQNQLIVLYAKWNVLIELFGSDSKNLDVINRTLPHFFILLQNTYVDNVIMGIGRLLDPTMTHGKENLSLLTLHSIIKKSHHSILAKQMEEDIAKVKLIEQPLREHRNKKIAHSDYRIALNIEKLQPFYISNIKEALHTIATMLNRVSAYFYDSSTAFDALDDDGNHMIFYLEKAIAKVEQERAALLSRKTNDG